MTLTMTQEITLDKVMNEVGERDRGNADYVTAYNNLRVDNEGNFAFLRTENVKGPSVRDIPFKATDWAEGQMLSKLGMPAQYFRKAKQEDPELFRQHFNYWAAKSPDNALIRTKIHGNQGLIRGAMSDKYSILDNDNVLHTLAGILRGNESHYKVEMFHLDDRRMHLRLSYPDLTRPLGVLADGAPDYNRIGMDLINSEVGAASMNVAAMVWRLVCSNGLKVWGRDGDAFVQRHIHLKTSEFQGRMAEAIVKQLHAGSELLDEYDAKQAYIVENPFETIDSLAQKGGFSKEFVDVAKSEFEGDCTAYGIINSFTRAARTLPNERRLEAEKFAGKLVRENRSYWEAVGR